MKCCEGFYLSRRLFARCFAFGPNSLSLIKTYATRLEIPEIQEAKSSKKNDKRKDNITAASASATTVATPATRLRKLRPMAISKMTEDMARIELENLNVELNRHDALYYGNDTSEIKDAAYDKLVRRAEDLEGKYVNLRGTVKKLLRVGVSYNTSLAVSLVDLFIVGRSFRLTMHSAKMRFASSLKNATAK